MIEGVLGIIDKMRIEVYPTREYNDLEIIKTFFVQVNPESYTTSREIHYFEGQPIGASNQDLKFNRIGSEEVTFDFLFDSSGVIPPAKMKEGKVEGSPLADSLVDVVKPAPANPFEQAATVERELEEFKRTISGYHGDTHQPRYLRLLWGGYQLECRLTNINVEYKLFRRDGRPIRAKAVCKFKGTQTYKEMQAEQNQQSPDVSHEFVIRQEDSLPLMADRTYRQSRYYIDVAKANNLLSFRRLTTGNTLFFPPVK